MREVESANIPTFKLEIIRLFVLHSNNDKHSHIHIHLKFNKKLLIILQINDQKHTPFHLKAVIRMKIAKSYSTSHGIL